MTSHPEGQCDDESHVHLSMKSKAERIAAVRAEYTERLGDIYLGYKRERDPILIAHVNKSDAEFEKAIAPLEAEFHKADQEARDILAAKIRAVEEEEE